MEGMFTSVKVVDREKNIIVTQKKDRPGKYVLNTVEEYSAKNEADAIRYAKQKLTEHCQVTKSRSIKKIFDYTVPRFFSGDFVYIPDPGEEEILGFYFKKISYDLHNSYVSLSADLGYTAYLPPLTYKDPEKKEEGAE